MTLAMTQVRWEPWQGPEKEVTCSDLTHSRPVSPTGKLRHREVNRCARIPQLVSGTTAESPQRVWCQSLCTFHFSSVSKRHLGPARMDRRPAPEAAQGTRVWTGVSPPVYAIKLGIASENRQDAASQTTLLPCPPLLLTTITAPGGLLDGDALAVKEWGRRTEWLRTERTAALKGALRDSPFPSPGQ